jgi:hypothetical protein
MPLGSKTWSFIEDVARLERNEMGVYELLDSSDEILYIGYGKVMELLLEHFTGGTHPIPCAISFSVEYTWNEERAKERCRDEVDAFYRENGRYPKFN